MAHFIDSMRPTTASFGKVIGVVGIAVMAIAAPSCNGIGGVENRAYEAVTCRAPECKNFSGRSLLGLVDTGTPATSPHHDETHGAHCTNPACLMHYSIKNGAIAHSFVTGQIPELDDSCLADLHANGTSFANDPVLKPIKALRIPAASPCNPRRIL